MYKKYRHAGPEGTTDLGREHNTRWVDTPDGLPVLNLDSERLAQGSKCWS